MTTPPPTPAALSLLVDVGHPVWLSWWDDAVLIATLRATESGRRQRVEADALGRGLWCVSEARPSLRLVTGA